MIRVLLGSFAASSLIYFSGFFLAGVVLSGCGEADTAGESQKPKINGKHADLYYRRFIFQKTPSGNFTYLANHTEIEITPEGEADSVFVRLELFLTPNFDYVLNYREFYSDTGERVWIEKEPQAVHRGKWKVDGVQLVLEPIGKGEAEKVESQEMIAVKFDVDIGRAKIKGEKVFFARTELF